jgi:D-alanyl-D-alanine carboxypeptidase/D-alanyl-D-alanine-endopeptidase (penicillin-binding protein 4)
VLQPWSVHRSELLPQVLRDINKHSDNLAARNLMLALAPGFPMQAATLPGARQRVQGWLRQQGLGHNDILVDSGSGLSRSEQGKPRAMVHLLRLAWQAPQRDAFVSSLPVAGVDGTLANRMTQGRATGRAFLKTGTLLDTRALAGYVLGRSGMPYALTALVNHAEPQRATPMMDRVVEWLANQG